MDWETPKRLGFGGNVLAFGVGDCIRDWQTNKLPSVIYPYEKIGGLPIASLPVPLSKWLWPFKTLLSQRTVFGKSMSDNGRHWYEHLEHYVSKLRTPLSIAFSFVATHNHFVLDRGGKVFKRSAPIIKLKEDATEDDHLALLGLLNSSTACFWMHQMFHNKGRPGADAAAADERWEFRFEHDGTKLKSFPIPDGSALSLAKQLDMLAEESSRLDSKRNFESSLPTSESINSIDLAASIIRSKMIALQEELDWHCYKLYGLVDEDYCYTSGDLPRIEVGQRAFEIVMARLVEKENLKTAWFKRMSAEPCTELPAEWPEEYRNLVQARIDVINSESVIRIVESAEFKRRWQAKSWDDQQQRELLSWLLDRLETAKYTNHTKTDSLFSVAQLADIAAGDPEFMQVAAIYQRREDFELARLMTKLIASESVPMLPVLRYKAGGLRNREQWEDTWNLQRQEDAGEDVGDIPVPPKYKPSDFLKTDYWRLRGKLDVPKERWISFPHAETDADNSLVVGWAGWNHVQQATAVVAYYDSRKREGWSAERLTPLLASLDQLLPWIHQWHPEIDPEYNESAGDSFQALLNSELQELGLTIEDVRNWTPPKKAKKKATKKNATKKKSTKKNTAKS